MNIKRFLIFICIWIFIISGCSQDTNKANIDEEMFNEGKQIVKLYAQAYNGEDKKDEASKLAEAFLEKYPNIDSKIFLENNANNESDLTVKELLFVKSIDLLYIKYKAYSLQKVTESLGGNSNSDETKLEIKEILLQIEDEFGISLE